MPREGIEPSYPKTTVFEAAASACSAISAKTVGCRVLVCCCLPHCYFPAITADLTNGASKCWFLWGLSALAGVPALLGITAEATNTRGSRWTRTTTAVKAGVLQTLRLAQYASVCFHLPRLPARHRGSGRCSGQAQNSVSTTRASFVSFRDSPRRRIGRAPG